MKKCGRYGPKDVPGDYIDECFKQTEFGEHDCYVQESVPFLFTATKRTNMCAWLCQLMG